jgi:hypothetical protein
MRYEIKRILRDIELETPMLFSKLIERIEGSLAKVCREVKYELDTFPDVKQRPLDDRVVYRTRRHRDTLYCNGKKYVIVVNYWEIEVDGTRIVTKFKLIDVEYA